MPGRRAVENAAIRWMLMAVSALIFDMDGTMVDSMPWHARSWGEFCRRHGIGLDIDEVLRRTTGRTGVECIRELMGQGTDEAQAWSLIGEKEAIYRELFAPAFTEVAGFRRFAQEARQRGLKLAVATAGDRHNIDFTLGRIALQSPPDAVVGGDEGLRGKPHPDLFLEAASRLGMTPESCIVFEDAPFGIEAAGRAGMRAVAICTTHDAGELSGPHVIDHAKDYDELLARGWLARLAAG
ncbi:MAG: Beta-phosphoglucomutase [uncultured Ramlibacter sp.]|uniref:Beta-phosphoglucomutase n=1 Tax=uncultured Ramlibacter sp. TaxID=260755 RepID=A0A6J4Q7A0_9BURK|nr:MAG: Beta-phosphoglucomutase [uncultured Ramlibacter sp.]